MNDDRRKYQAEWARLRRDENASAVAMLKLEAGCADCGYDAHPEALDFDHIGSKKRAVSWLVKKGRAIETILSEIEECEVVCANCHRVRTRDRRG